MEQPFWVALIASGLAAAVTSAGIYAIRRFRSWAERNSIYFVSFAAGVLIAASFLHITPKAFAMTSRAPAFLLAGYLFLHLFNRFITAYVCGRNPDSESAIGSVPLLGIGLHSFLDGVIYSVTFTTSVFTGALAATGMVLHEFPEGIITYLLLVRAGFGERAATGWALLAAAFSTPLGMLLSYPWMQQIDEDLLGMLLAFSAGALIYVGATHLMPQAEQEKRSYSLVALAGGVLVAVIITLAGH